MSNGQLVGRGSKKEKDQEASFPVQSRVNVVNLARLDKFWLNEGYHIRTMSQLISWSIDLLCEVLENNGKMKDEMRLVEAHRYMEARGLYQRSMRKKGYKKIGTALRFESMREEGIDPGDYTPVQYNMLHRRKGGSVEPYEREGEVKFKEAFEEYEEMRRKEQLEDLEEEKRKVLEQARASGMIVEEERTEVKENRRVLREGMSDDWLREYNEEREEEVLRKESQEIDPEFVNKYLVKE